ncbi:MAG: amino acid permease [Myxococcota bacterium]|nr:amino acid permease [Myxococcota bacterium]
MRVIGPVGAVAVVAGSMLGIGIFLTPPLVAAAAPSAAWFYGLWLAGGLVALSGALVYAQLGAMRPEAGGDVIFQRAALGPAVAGASGAVMFSLAFAGSLAAMAAAVCQYQLATVTGLDLSLPLLGIPRYQLAGMVVVLALTGLNVLSVRLTSWAQTALTAVPMVLLIGLSVWGLVGEGAGGGMVEAPTGLLKAWMAIYFTYAGWPAVIYVAGEVRDPDRSLPVGLIGGTALITALYLLLCMAMVHVLGMPGLAGAGESGSAMAAVLLPNGAVIMSGLVALALLASINGTALGGARVALAMAQQGVLPAALAARTGGVPTRALWVQAGIACLLLLTGGFSTILSITTLAMMLIGSLTVISALILHARGERGSFSAPLWPLPALVYLTSSLAAVVLLVLQSDGLLEPLLGVIAFVVVAGLLAIRGRSEALSKP